MPISANGHKHLIVIAGPNGSGKTTLADSLFNKNGKSSYFVNSDNIAAGISPYNIKNAAFQAGRTMLKTIHDLLNKNDSFAFETTLSGRGYCNLLKEARQRKYKISIFFIYVASIGAANKRIRQRVKNGGHNVPVMDVKRRFPRCFENFWKLYRPLCDEWYIFNNSHSRPHMEISRIEFLKLDKPASLLFQGNFLKKAAK